jgi:arylsulfatase A-like enzyme
MKSSVLRPGLFAFSFVLAIGSLVVVAAAEKQPTEDPLQKTPYNILLIICDQQSYKLQPAEGFKLPARDTLARRGITFGNHYIAAAMCTPSRGVMFSGQPPQVNRIFDQLETCYVPSLRTDKPSLGTIMKQLGYTTAYYGKFELLKDILWPSEKVNYSEAIKEYGFDHFAPDGEKNGTPDQGYNTDTYTSALGVRWLRANAKKLNNKGKPWFMVVSYVSPHDIMYADANLKGEQTQVPKVSGAINRPPENGIFAKQWSFPLSPSRNDPIDQPGRPAAQMEYHVGWSGVLGTIPSDRDDMWRIYYNYYLNLIRDNDRNLQLLLNSMEELDLWKNTVVVFTADHGELAGSHGGLRGKGPFPYEEETHVPFVVAHPSYPGGKTCPALTSHIDLVPTIAGLSGASKERVVAATKGLPGHDFSRLLNNPEKVDTHEIRDGILFNYLGLLTVGAKFCEISLTTAMKGKPTDLSKNSPDLSKRGFLSFTFDGRYKYTRYYAPAKFNTPTTLEEILRDNDIELFDLKSDPDERKNLAAEPEKHKATIMRMNALLNDLIAREVGRSSRSAPA